MDEVLQAIQDSDGEEWKGRILVLDRSDDLWNGVAIRIKDVKAYSKMRKSGEEFTISSQSLEDNEQILEFTPLVFCTASMKMLHQAYYHSVSVGAIYKTFRYFIELQCKKRAEQALSALTEEKDEKAVEKVHEQNRKFQRRILKSFSYKPVYRKESAKSLVAELKHIDKISVAHEVTDFAPTSKLHPLGKIGTTIRSEFRFSHDKNAWDRVKGKVMSYVSDTEEKWTIEGVDGNGRETIIRALDNKDILDERDFDSEIRQFAINSKDLVGSLRKSGVMNSILELAKGKCDLILRSRSTAPPPK